MVWKLHKLSFAICPQSINGKKLREINLHCSNGEKVNLKKLLPKNRESEIMSLQILNKARFEITT